MPSRLHYSTTHPLLLGRAGNSVPPNTKVHGSLPAHSPGEVDQRQLRLPHRLGAGHAPLERPRQDHLQHGVRPGRDLVGPRRLRPAVCVALPQQLQHLLAGGHLLRTAAAAVAVAGVQVAILHIRKKRKECGVE